MVFIIIEVPIPPAKRGKSYLTALLSLSGTGLTLLLLGLALLEKGLWDKDLVLGWDGNFAAGRMSEQSGCFGNLSLQAENCSTAAFSAGDFESR